MPTADVCRRHGISSATFYKYKSKYGGLEVSDARRLRTLEQENARLKKLLADQMLDNAMLKEINAKMYGPPCYCKMRDDAFGLHKCIRPLISG